MGFIGGAQRSMTDFVVSAQGGARKSRLGTAKIIGGGSVRQQKNRLSRRIPAR